MMTALIWVLGLFLFGPVIYYLMTLVAVLFICVCRFWWETIKELGLDIAKYSKLDGEEQISCSHKSTQSGS